VNKYINTKYEDDRKYKGYDDIAAMCSYFLGDNVQKFL